MKWLTVTARFSRKFFIGQSTFFSIKVILQTVRQFFGSVEKIVYLRVTMLNISGLTG